MGTVFQIPWTYVPGGTEVTGLLHRYSFTVISMALTDGAIPVNDLVLKSTKKKAVIFGSECSGLCEDTLANSDHIAIIPIHNNVDSLNVAASSAVALYELFSK